MTHRFKYKAFLSYSHKDQKWARWLHEKLERYRIPRSLRRARTTLGTRVGLVFKDREELATSHSLSEVIRRALDDSENLIVIASTHSADSRWVNEEVKQFLETRDPSNLILVIPPQERSADVPVLEALRQHGLEPVAADARANADGQSRALRKVIASLLGVNFDELQRRDRARTRQRFASAGAIGLVILAFVSMLTFEMRRSANEADAQRAQSAQLANYLVDDLSSRLAEYEEVGTLDEGLTRALQFYEPIDPDQMVDETLENYRTALIGIGLVRIRQGKPEEALGVFRRAETISLEIVNREKNNAERWQEQSLSTYYIGEAFWEMQDVPSAAQHIEKSVEYAQKALDLAPEEHKYQLEVLYGLNNLGAINSRLNNWQKAEAFSIQALELAGGFIDSSAANDEQRVELMGQEVEAISWLSEITQTLGRFDDAFNWHQREIQLRQALFDETNNIHHQARLADALGYYAKSLESVGRIGDQARALEESIGISESLIREDPDNVVWRIKLFASQAILANSLVERSRLIDAEKMLDGAAAGLQQILENEGTVVAAFHLAYVYSSKAYMLLENDGAQARVQLQLAFDQLAKPMDESSVHPIALGNYSRSVIVDSSLDVLDGEPIDQDRISHTLELVGNQEPNIGSIFDIATRAMLLTASSNYDDAEPLISYLDSIGYESAFYQKMLPVLRRN